MCKQISDFQIRLQIYKTTSITPSNYKLNVLYNIKISTQGLTGIRIYLFITVIVYMNFL